MNETRRKLNGMRLNGNLVVATFNLRHGAPAEKNKNRGNPSLAAEACASIGADILALQEVDKRVLRSGWTDMAALAAKASGMRPIFVKTKWIHGGHYGNALLVRGEIDDYEELKLQDEPRPKARPEPRNAILATIRIGNHRISVAATHLSSKRSHASEQLPIVLSALADYSSGNPKILVGDLNMTEAQVATNPTSASMTWAGGHLTYKAPNPHEGIDHIAVDGLTIHSVEAKPQPISDHLALIAEVS